VVKHIATGGMGAVYKAVDHDLGRNVALKVLSSELAVKPAIVERFRREAKAAAELRHENIVSIYDFGEISGTHYLALEFVEGNDLQDYINQKGKLDPEEARQLVMQAARALGHANQQGFVHRDIKPSNFLIGEKDGKPLLKMTDLGLARKISDEEFRVTRDGTTVGTVDYMSPEQARDSGSADIRSDIYSLGCTFYHMLAGRAPFAEGSLTERIYKHVETEPEDIRKFNPAVDLGLSRVLRRMLEKKPGDRYQTPEELIKDLEHPEKLTEAARWEVLANLSEGLDDKPKVKKTSSRSSLQQPGAAAETATELARKTDGKITTAKKAGKRDKGAQEARFPAKRASLFSRLPVSPFTLAGAAFLGLALAVAAWVISRSGDEEAKPTQETNRGPSTNPVALPKKREPLRKKEQDQETKRVDSHLPPSLYQPKQPLDIARLNQEFQEPIVPLPGADAHVVKVHRAAQSTASLFGSLAEACKATANDKATIIEIEDNGPLFEPSIAVKDRNLAIRAAKGYRPLIAWQGAGSKDNQLLSVHGGNLVFEGIDVVVWQNWPAAAAPAALLQVTGGSLAARDCTFSTSGKNPRGVAVARLRANSERAKDKQSGPMALVLSKCFARGADLTAVAVQASRAAILVDRCLLVGGENPILQVAGYNDNPTTMRLRRSTLVAGKTLLQVTAAEKGGSNPDVRWYGWDVLLAQSNAEVDGDMVAVADGVGAGKLSWRAVNCLYAGWKRLLTGRDSIAATDMAAWRLRWQRNKGDKAIASNWPKDAPLDPGEVSPRTYGTARTEAAYAATGDPKEMLGCNIDVLLADWPSWSLARKAWLVLTYKRYPTTPPNLPDGTVAARGDSIDLNRVDLGEVIRQKLAAIQPNSEPPKVVLCLTGTGDCPTSPIRVSKGVHLVLHFEKPGKSAKRLNRQKPLVIVPRGETAANKEALFDVDDGVLTLIGGTVQLSKTSFFLPRHMLRLRQGELHLLRCRLEGPLGRADSSAYRGLIQCQGSGLTEVEKTPACTANESVLISGRTVFRMTGTGVRLSVARSLLLAAGAGIELNAGPDLAQPPTMQCLLERNTIAVMGAVLHLVDRQTGFPVEPIVVQADNNLFLDPFLTKLPHQAALLHYEKAALAHGLLLWQGKDNGFDNRLLQYAAAAEESAPPSQGLRVWQSLWGEWGEQNARPINLGKLKTASFPLEKLQLERLALPASLQPKRGQAPLGADLRALGIGKKTSRP
jgi:serine/threonine-protein kinase